MAKSTSNRSGFYLCVFLLTGATLYAYFTYPPIEFLADLVIRIVYSIFGLAVALVFFVVLELNLQADERRITEIRHINSSRKLVRKTITGKQEPLYTYENRILYQRLIDMLYGNDETAARLVTSTHHRFPDKSFKWVVEKTIDDLIRDRSR